MREGIESHEEQIWDRVGAQKHYPPKARTFSGTMKSFHAVMRARNLSQTYILFRSISVGNICATLQDVGVRACIVCSLTS